MTNLILIIILLCFLVIQGAIAVMLWAVLNNTANIGHVLTSIERTWRKAREDRR